MLREHLSDVEMSQIRRLVPFQPVHCLRKLGDREHKSHQCLLGHHEELFLAHPIGRSVDLEARVSARLANALEKTHEDPFRVCHPATVPTKGRTMPLTQHMRQALQDAAKHALRRVHDDQPGKPLWPAPSGSLRALELRGYIERTETTSRNDHRVEIWSITELGKAALTTHWAAEQADQYVAVGGGYTTDHSRAVDRDPQMGALPRLDADRLSVRWKRLSAEEFMAAKDRREVARRLARSARRAA